MPAAPFAIYADPPSPLTVRSVFASKNSLIGFTLSFSTPAFEAYLEQGKHGDQTDANNDPNRNPHTKEINKARRNSNPH